MEFHTVVQHSPKLLDRMRAEIRVRHYSIRTEQTYIDWARRYIFFHDNRYPQDMGAAEVQAFLSHLAVDRRGDCSQGNQAFARGVNTGGGA